MVILERKIFLASAVFTHFYINLHVSGMTSNITMRLNAESLAIRNSFCGIPEK